jgi:NADPH:quinone reductase-like Zn-dependent oxidoreductase
VYASVLYQANAEYLAVPESLVAHKPETLSFQQAAALPFAAITAWTALVKVAGLNESNTAGKRVIIPRAAGGVGSFAVQLVKAWGGHVTALCSTRNVALVRSLGVDEVVDYKNVAAREPLRDYDVALDTAFDTEALLLSALKVGSGACYTTVVSPKLKLVDQHGLEEGLRSGQELIAQRVAEQRALGRGYHWVFAEPDGQALAQIARLVDTGKIRPVIDKLFGLSQIVEAHERCESGAAQGKIVLDLQETC